jgi:hypothetical protein
MNINLSVLVHGMPVIHPEVEILKLVGLYLSKNSESRLIDRIFYYHRQLFHI